MRKKLQEKRKDKKEEKNSEAKNKNFSDCCSDRSPLQLYAADRDDKIKRENDNSQRRQPDPRRNRIAEQGLYHG
mgnify:CR=1 FL=1